jgi:hypothetical protein
MNESTIAIIDHGVDRAYRNLAKFKITEVPISNVDDNISSSYQSTSHGTNIANIVANNTKSYKILSLKLCGMDSLRPTALKQAVDFCSREKNIRFINISLGFQSQVQPDGLIQSLMNCVANGAEIIAACHPDPKVKFYPASLPFVFGVGVALASNLNEFEYLGEGSINVISKGVHQRLITGTGNHLIRGGASYAAASFTSILGNLCMNQSGLTGLRLRALLKERSTQLRSLQHLGSTHHQLEAHASIALTDDLKILAFGTDDPCLKTFYLQRTNFIKLVMRYPVNPANCFDLKVSKESREVDGILSYKLAEHANTLLIGNFLLNPHMMNAYFGYALIDLCVEMDFSFICLDTYLRMVVIRAIESSKKKFLGKVY